MVYYFIALIVLIVDQLSKWLVVQNMTIGESIQLIPHIFYLTSLRNTGAAWNILEGQFVFFFLVTGVVLVIIIYYMQRYGRKQPLLGTALGLIIGGALGNFVDRLFRGEVVDFFHVYIFQYSFPVFNVADASLSIGVFFMIIYLLKDGKKE
ncbi:signal peptidase II [Sporolactobacillus sp. Y61]|uniref:Lipoprotein signal peptidase n=1 Tax=Sporolactobacillus sp. Y61 TaxID=3160863 RepID=A0AAU8ICM8_9BACL|nr:signal peptidase II [Sporolactobacillus sp. THM19-2]RYL92889.1 lipoprotein signal peptidase [Sporolactobacillus sp. THM19-2]